MKKSIRTSKAPGAIGAYSQGIQYNGMVFTSGQLGIHPETGEMPSSIREQSRQALENVKGVLEAVGSGMEKAINSIILKYTHEDFSMKIH